MKGSLTWRNRNTHDTKSIGGTKKKKQTWFVLSVCKHQPLERDAN